MSTPAAPSPSAAPTSTTPISAAPYLDPAVPIAARVADLVGRMTLPEKIGQMMQLPAGPGEDLVAELTPIVVDVAVGSILHASPEQLALAHDLVATTRLQTQRSSSSAARSDSWTRSPRPAPRPPHHSCWSCWRASRTCCRCRPTPRAPSSGRPTLA